MNLKSIWSWLKQILKKLSKEKRNFQEDQQIMHPEAKKAFIRKLKDLIPKLPTKFEPGKGLSEFVFKGGVSFYVDQNLDEYSELLHLLTKSCAGEDKFTEQFYQDKLNFLIAETIKGKQNEIPQLLEEIVLEVSNFKQEQTVLIPVYGVLVSSDVKVGRVVFKPANNGVLNSLLTEEMSEDQKTFISDYFEQDMKHAGTVSQFKIVAEAARAKERAKEETNKALELVRYLITPMYGFDSTVKIGLAGDYLRAIEKYLVVSDAHSVNSGGSIVGAIEPFNFDRLTSKLKNQLAFSQLSSLLEKVKPNDYEQMVLRCLHWFSTGLMQKQPENRLLNFVTCLETAFTTKSQNGPPIANSVAEGMALFLVQKLEDRKILKKRIKDFYSLRSTISHGGHSPVNEPDLISLQLYSGWLLVELAKNLSAFNSRKDFLDSIETKRLS